MLFITLLLVGILLFSSVNIFYIKSYALKKLLDVPNQRSSHQFPTPRGGGLGIVLAFSLALSVLLMENWLSDTGFLIFSWSVLVAAIGFWDDHQHVPVRYRFLIHLVSATGALYCMQGLGTIAVAGFTIDGGICGNILAVIYLVWLLNLFNFMDGIDGIAASEAVFCAGAVSALLFSITLELFAVAASLSAAAAGFLLWNWPPARIFMGDVGSGFLGFVLGILILLANQRNSVFLSIGIILMAVFIVDASYTLLYRFFSGQQWHQAHCCHAYQHAAKRYGHLKVVLTVWMINVLFLLPVAVFVFNNPAFNMVGICAVYLPLIYIAFRLGAGKEYPNV